MLNPQNPQQVRTYFYNSWQKYQKKETLTDLEQLVCDCIVLHPEYHSTLADINNINSEYKLHENPFFHLSMHLSIVEQISINQPNGITSIFNSICTKYNYHDAIHLMINCLQITLSNTNPNNINEVEKLYLAKLSELL
ncbi:MAG: hypothetical protein RLZZ210_1668 [Pseudomonadota bacterium]|jgi:hypothetical protein